MYLFSWCWTRRSIGVLIERQMPLVDGSLATRMIRFSEMESKHRTQLESRFPPTPGYRVAIIAFSEFLQEDSRFDYIQSGYVNSSSYDAYSSTPTNYSSFLPNLNQNISQKVLMT